MNTKSQFLHHIVEKNRKNNVVHVADYKNAINLVYAIKTYCKTFYDKGACNEKLLVNNTVVCFNLLGRREVISHVEEHFTQNEVEFFNSVLKFMNILDTKKEHNRVFYDYIVLNSTV